MNDLANWIGPGIGAVIALSGVGLSNWVASRHRRQDRKWRVQDETRLRLIERGEELYTLVDSWSKLSIAPFSFYRLAMAGTIDYNTALDNVIAANSKFDQKFERIDLLIDVYFPEIKATFDEARKCVHLANSVESEFRSLYKSGVVESAEHKNRFSEFMVESEKGLKIARNEIAQSVRQSVVASIED